MILDIFLVKLFSVKTVFKICLSVNQHLIFYSLTKYKGTEYIIAWKSKGLFKPRFHLLYNAFFVRFWIQNRNIIQ